jgi:hypothetical protein
MEDKRANAYIENATKTTGKMFYCISACAALNFLRNAAVEMECKFVSPPSFFVIKRPVRCENIQL